MLQWVLPKENKATEKKEKALHDKVRNQASTVENCREEIKTLHKDMHDLQQQDQERARQEKKRVVREEELLARADKAVNNQSAKTDRHDCFRAKQMEETRRLKTGFKEKLAAVVEEKEAEAITGKLKTKQKLEYTKWWKRRQDLILYCTRDMAACLCVPLP